MPDYEELSPLAPWRSLRTTKRDWDKADPTLLGSLLTQLHLIRAFEEEVLVLAGEGLVHGPSGRRAARSAPSCRCAPPIRSAARIAAITSSSPRPCPMSARRAMTRAVRSRARCRRY